MPLQVESRQRQMVDVEHRPGVAQQIVTAADGLHLIEVVPGIDPRTQVLDLCELPVRVREPLAVMDRRLLRDDAAPLLG